MASPYPNGSEQTFSTTEVAYHLQVTADTLRSWTRRFGRFLSVQAGGDDPRYTTSDVAALVMVQKLIEQGLSDEQVGERLTPKRIVRDETPSSPSAPTRAGRSSTPRLPCCRRRWATS